MPRRVLTYIENTVAEWRSAKNLLAGGAEGWFDSIPFGVQLAGLTHKGLGLKPNNEDGIAYMCDGSDRLVLAAADGIGGNPGGATASELLLGTLLTNLIKTRSVAKIVQRIIPEVFEKFHINALKNGQNPRATSSMGTTYATVDVRSNFANVYHQGDTKAILIRNGQVIAETLDHTLAEELRLAGNSEISGRSRHIVTNCVSLLHGKSHRTLKVSKNRWNLESGDWIILGSDGLFDVLEPSEVTTIVNSFKKAHEVVYALDKCVRMLVQKGAKDDNLSIIAYQHLPGIVS